MIGEEKLKILYAPNYLKNKEFINKFDKYGKEVLKYLVMIPYDRQDIKIEVRYMYTEEAYYLSSVFVKPYCPGKKTTPTF
jgi:hypothetical protein